MDLGFSEKRAVIKVKVMDKKENEWPTGWQGGIKCGNRGTGFLDSEGSHR